MRGRILSLGTAVALAASGCTSTSSGGGEVGTAPSDLTYSSNPAVYTIGSPITPNTPSSKGDAIEMYSVAPDLPPGLVLNPFSGVVNGTPTSVTRLATYTVTGFNKAGQTGTGLSITVNDVPPSGLNYSVNPATYALGVAIVPNMPTSGGGSVVSYAVSPPLPPGLGLSPVSGIIAGTPTAITPTASYAVTATNSGGSSTVSINISVVPPAPPVISAPPASLAIFRGEVATFGVTASGMGALTYQWQLDGSPIAGATVSTYTTPRQDLAGSGARFTVVVSDAFGGMTESPPAQLTVKSGGFLPTGSMGTERASHTATLLADGRVLVAGGSDTSGVLSSAELYDPITGTFSPTGTMLTGHSHHTATLLRNGTVLIAGGGVDWSHNVELYDPASGAFGPTGNTPYSPETAMLLQDGRVLLLGIDADAYPFLRVQLYDPDAGSFASLPLTYFGWCYSRVSGTVLQDGKVLILLGKDPALIFDPTTETFVNTSSRTTTRCIDGTPTMLASGKVLVAGGATGITWFDGPLASAELYDPASGTWVATGSMQTPHAYPLAILLADGKVLVVDLDGHSSEQYDPATETWSVTGRLSCGDTNAGMVRLENGRVLVEGVSTCAELYE